MNITGGPGMSLVEIEEATEIIHSAAREEVNVILGAVIDESLKDEIMVTVIATGFNRKVSTPMTTGLGGMPMVHSGIRPSVRPPQKAIERIPTGVTDLKSYDPPAFMRRGYDLNFGTSSPSAAVADDSERQRIDKTDTEKPAFLRKIMD